MSGSLLTVPDHLPWSRSQDPPVSGALPTPEEGTASSPKQGHREEAEQIRLAQFPQRTALHSLGPILFLLSFPLFVKLGKKHSVSNTLLGPHFLMKVPMSRKTSINCVPFSCYSWFQGSQQ